MRLLVPARMSLVLRRITSSPMYAAAAAAPRKNRSKRVAASSEPFAAAPKRVPASAAEAAVKQRKHDKKEVAAPAATFVPSMSQSQVLQQLWELSKTEEYLPFPGETRVKQSRIKAYSAHNDFPTVVKLLEEYDQSEDDKQKIHIVNLLPHVMWSAVRAKSLGALPPSILQWIEDKMIQLSNVNPQTKELMIWLLSILRDDWPQLLQLLHESCSKRGVVGPEMRGKDALRHLALTYLQAGKEEEFKLLWTMPVIPSLDDNDGVQDAALVHHAMLRSVPEGKPNPEMLRWYAQSLAKYQRMPIEEEPMFTTMVEPMIRALGGKIEKWAENDQRMERLRKWRDDYGDLELRNLVSSLIDFMDSINSSSDDGSLEDLRRLGGILNRLSREQTRGKNTIVIDWLNLCEEGDWNKNPLNLVPHHSLVVVGQENLRGECHAASPVENKRIRVLDLTLMNDMNELNSDICSYILAVVSRGHLLTNDTRMKSFKFFRHYLENKSKDAKQSFLLKDYLNYAVLRHDHKQTIQLPVDHSRAAQWIDTEKKELAFTVARKPNSSWNNPFRYFDYYSIHID
ncbi:hypothetical protein PMAYCL1PPCAC_22706 [Pristionchus mayeri]|uniref:Uncharacterized protein n=1 Tax=Pristionchus mayeri TaxID=1317129 RepID=A0AAN5CXH4_9BILA|nr:hypothetical protein PMAYCL1PPCAC_22706 [Pristionchus mayeri]